MVDITIEMVSKSHAEELLKFEKENKNFFEENLLPRGEGYYSLKNIKEILEEIVMEQKEGLCYMYLIRNESKEIVGRVNLSSIVGGPFQKAEVGYRIGEKYNGYGYATKAVKLVLEEAFDKYNLHRIEAGTSQSNIGSQIVLIKNGFEFIGRTRHIIKINGEWQDGINFEKLK